MSTKDSLSDRIGQTAAQWRKFNERAGHPITHTQALERVKAARTKGDNKRNSKE